MKNNIGVIILFLLLLIASLSFGVYNAIKCEDLNNSYDKIVSKYKNASSNSKNYITISNIESKTSNYAYNLYAYNYPVLVIGFNGKLYQIEAVGESLRGCLGDLTGTDKVKFTEGIYKCETLQGSSVKENPFIKKLDIKEKSIEKVVISRNPSSASVYDYIIFFIYKTGNVEFSLNSDKLQSFRSLEGHKLKSIERFYCSFGAYDTCTGNYKLEVITKDNKYETISIEDSEL